LKSDFRSLVPRSTLFCVLSKIRWNEVLAIAGSDLGDSMDAAAEFTPRYIECPPLRNDPYSTRQVKTATNR